VKKQGIFSIEKNYGTFNTSFKKHFTFKKKTLFFSQFSQFFLSLKYKYTIMCNYLNKYTNLNDAHYIRYTFSGIEYNGNRCLDCRARLI
jgi:hypothetical protein